MQNSTLQWFPGHMQKAKRLIQENLPLVDLVIELLDARIPISSQNPMLQEILGEKPRLIVLNKADLAANVDFWLKKFREDNFSAVAVDSVKGMGIKKLISLAKSLAESKTNKFSKSEKNRLLFPILEKKSPCVDSHRAGLLLFT